MYHNLLILSLCEVRVYVWIFPDNHQSFSECTLTHVIIVKEVK